MNSPSKSKSLALRPHQLDGVDPLLRVFVAGGVLALLDAEHLELALVPADHDVEPEAAFADVVGGDHLLGRDDRMKQRRVHGAEHGDALGRRQQAAGPGDGFERRLLVVGVAAVALPAADRQHEIDAGLVRHLRQAQIVGPGSGPALRHLGHGAARRAVRAEQPDLQRDCRRRAGSRCGDDEFAFGTIIPQAWRRKLAAVSITADGRRTSADAKQNMMRSAARPIEGERSDDDDLACHRARRGAV